METGGYCGPGIQYSPPLAGPVRTSPALEERACLSFPNCEVFPSQSLFPLWLSNGEGLGGQMLGFFQKMLDPTPNAHPATCPC